MRAMLIVNAEPLFGLRSDFFQSFKDVHIKDRLSVTSVEAYDKAILHRLAGLDELKLDAVFLPPIRQPPAP